MRDPEKPLKIISGIVSAVLVIFALLYFNRGEPKKAEAVLEYSAPPGFDPSELTDRLHQLRKERGFLMRIVLRSKLTEMSEPGMTEVVSNLGSRLSFDADMKEPTISIRFTHRNAATAIAVSNAAAEIVRESLDNLQHKLAAEIRVQDEEVANKLKLLDQMRRVEAIGQRIPPTQPESELPSEKNIAEPRSSMLIAAEEGYDRALRKLEALKAKPVLSLGSIRPAKLTSN